MEKCEVTNTVIELINGSLLEKKDEIKPDDHLIDSIGMDSIGFVELSTGLEEKYMVDIADEKLEALQTVEDVVSYVLSCPKYVN